MSFCKNLVLSLYDRRPGEESDSDYCKDSCSDGSSDCEHERGSFMYSREQQSYYNRTNGVPLKMDGLSFRDQHIALQEGSSSDEGESGNSQGRLLFEYLERDSPFSREPLADKVSPSSSHLIQRMYLIFFWREPGRNNKSYYVPFFPLKACLIIPFFHGKCPKFYFPQHYWCLFA